MNIKNKKKEVELLEGTEKVSLIKEIQQNRTSKLSINLHLLVFFHNAEEVNFAYKVLFSPLYRVFWGISNTICPASSLI